MTDHTNFSLKQSELELTPEITKFLNDTKDSLKGADKRLFMARTVNLLGKGGQRKAERELGWNRTLIRKGTRELKSGFICIDNFQARGRKPAEYHLPTLLDDIRDIVDPVCQADPTFVSTNLYSPVTAAQVRKQLIEQKNYSEEKVPSRRTISDKLNSLNYKLKKVAKCKPQKK
jgi:hypothetical protein